MWKQEGACGWNGYRHVCQVWIFDLLVQGRLTGRRRPVAQEGGLQQRQRGLYPHEEQASESDRLVPWFAKARRDRVGE